MRDWRPTPLEWLSNTRDLDHDLGSGHTACRSASVIDRYLYQISLKLEKLWTDVRMYGRTDVRTYWRTDIFPSNVIRSTRSRPNNIRGGNITNMKRYIAYGIASFYGDLWCHSSVASLFNFGISSSCAVVDNTSTRTDYRVVRCITVKQRREYGGMYLPPYFFLPQHIIFSKKILCCAPCPQHNIIFEKIMCCGKSVTT